MFYENKSVLGLTHKTRSSDPYHVRIQELTVLSGLRPQEWSESDLMGPTHCSERVSRLLIAVTLQLFRRTKLICAGDRTSLRLAGDCGVRSSGK